VDNLKLSPQTLILNATAKRNDSLDNRSHLSSIGKLSNTHHEGAALSHKHQLEEASTDGPDLPVFSVLRGDHSSHDADVDVDTDADTDELSHHPQKYTPSRPPSMSLPGQNLESDPDFQHFMDGADADETPDHQEDEA
jgi:hypothetical protein